MRKLYFDLIRYSIDDAKLNFLYWIQWIDLLVELNLDPFHQWKTYLAVSTLSTCHLVFLYIYNYKDKFSLLIDKSATHESRPETVIEQGRANLFLTYCIDVGDGATGVDSWPLIQFYCPRNFWNDGNYPILRKLWPICIHFLIEFGLIIAHHPKIPRYTTDWYQEQLE